MVVYLSMSICGMVGAAAADSVSVHSYVNYTRHACTNVIVTILRMSACMVKW